MQNSFATTSEKLREREETTELIESLKALTEREQQQIKGIMIGMRLSKISATQMLQEV